MSWTLVILVTCAYAALMLRVAYWIGGLLAEADLFFQRERAGLCTCSRHRLCAACLRSLRDQAGTEGPAKPAIGAESSG